MEMKTLTVNSQTFQVKDENAVAVTEQTLTEEQKAQARTNIGALGANAVVDTLEFLGTNQAEFVSIHSESINQDSPALIFSSYEDCLPPVLRGISDGIEDNDAATVGQVNSVKQIAEEAYEAAGKCVSTDTFNSAIGDIENALDSILDIQNALIGTITFTHAGNTYTAGYGMTWAEFCDSEYNIGGFYVGDDGLVYDSAGDQIVIMEDGQPGHEQYGRYEIEANAEYYSL